MMGFFPLGIGFFMFCSFGINLVELFENILIEYILVLLTKEKNSRPGNKEKVNNEFPIFFGFKSIGLFFGTFFGGRLILSYDNRFCFLITTLVPLSLILFAIFFDEKPVDPRTKKKMNPREDWVKIKAMFKM